MKREIKTEEIINKLDGVLGEGVGKEIFEADKNRVRILVAELAKVVAEGLEKETEKKIPEAVGTTIEKILNEGEGEQKELWETESEMDGIIRDVGPELREKYWAVKIDFLIKIIKMVCYDYAKNEETLRAMAMILEFEEQRKELVEKIGEWRKEFASSKNEKGKLVDYLSELTGMELENMFEIERVEETILLFRKSDSSRFFPVAVFFPGLTDEELVKIEEMLEEMGEVGIPTEYKKFLKHYNGAMIGFEVNFWGTRRSYNPEKHLEQHFSLVNSTVDRTLKALLSKTEVVVASDRQRNVYTVDIVSGAVTGLVRPNGDELAQPEKVTFASLGELIRREIEKEVARKH